MAAVKKDLEPEDVLPVTQREETAEEPAEAAFAPVAEPVRPALRQ